MTRNFSHGANTSSHMPMPKVHFPLSPFEFTCKLCSWFHKVVLCVLGRQVVLPVCAACLSWQHRWQPAVFPFVTVLLITVPSLLFAFWLGWGNQRAALCHWSRYEDEEMKLKIRNSPVFGIWTQEAKWEPSWSWGWNGYGQGRADLSIIKNIYHPGMYNQGNPRNKRAAPLPVVGQQYWGPISVLILASNWWLVRTVMWSVQIFLYLWSVNVYNKL